MGGKKGHGETGILTRREFVRRSGAGAGALAAAGTLGPLLGACGDDGVSPFVPGANPEVVVVGAGAFGGWTALHLQRMGARVTLVDQHGPGNSRSTSGDETRGIRSAYGNNFLWTEWANRAIERWKAFDEEWAEELGGGATFHSAGDLILRPVWTEFLQRTRENFDLHRVPYEILFPEDIAERWPAIRTEGMGVALFEPGAGVARARHACGAVAEVLRRSGGELLLARAEPGTEGNGLLRDVVLHPGESFLPEGDAGTPADGVLPAQVFVFALGPWFPKAFPELLEQRITIPMGHVYYYGTPEGDDRFSHPEMPSWNVPGITGWPSLPVEPSGFRVRVGGRDGGTDADATTREVPESYHGAPRALLAERFPDLADAPLLDSRACHYEITREREWIMDRHPRWSNVWVVGAGNAEGFKFGPVVGEYVAARILGNDPYPGLAHRFRL
jgi:sarcosine oxidase